MDFEGGVAKKVEDAEKVVHIEKRDTRGEFLPVEKEGKQASDTHLLLELIAKGNLDAIEKMGYKIKRFGEEEEGKEEEEEE